MQSDGPPGVRPPRRAGRLTTSTGRSASVLPELARGAAALARLGITTPRQALFYLPVPLRRLQRAAAARRPGARREAVGPGAGHRGEGREGIRASAAAGDRAAGRRHGHAPRRSGSGAASSRRRLRARRRDRDQRQGRAAWLAAAVHLARVLAGRPRVDAHRAGGAGLPAVGRRHPEAGRASCWPGSWSGRCRRSTTRCRPRSGATCRRLADALHAAHFPEEAADVPAALDRLAFDELLALQLTLAQARAAHEPS